MAQIRKYQPGGTTETPKGKMIIDGTEYSGDGFIEHMRLYRDTLDEKFKDQFGNIINAIESGKTLTYDSDADVLSGEVDWDTTKHQKKRLDRGTDRTKAGQFFGALNEGKEQQVRYAINALRSMPKYVKPEKKVEQPAGKSYDWSKQIELTYTLDPKDKKTRKVTHLGNANVITRIDQLIDLVKEDWSENDKFTGFDGHTRDQYKSLYDKYATQLVDIKERVQNGTWTEDDYKMLYDLGVVDKNLNTAAAGTPGNTSGRTISPSSSTGVHQPGNNSNGTSTPTVTTPAETVTPVGMNINTLSDYTRHSIHGADGTEYAYYYINPDNSDSDVYFQWNVDDYEDLYGYAIPIQRTMWDKMTSDFWNRVIGENRFRRLILNRLASPFITSWTNKWRNEADNKDVEPYGFTWDGSFYDRATMNSGRMENRKKRISMRKQGGVIMASKGIRVTSEYDKNEHAKVLPASGGLFSEMNDADIAELTSIGFDLASGITAAAGGGNPVAGGLGAVGSIAGLTSDIMRDGFDWGDVGRFAFGLTTDAVSALPVVGALGKSAKLAKVAKRLGKLSRHIRRGLMGVGAFSAIDALNNVVKGQSTLEDWRALSEGFQLMVGELNSFKNRKFISKYTKPAKPSTVVSSAAKRIDDTLEQLTDASTIKKSIVEKVIQKNPSLKKLNGNWNYWASNGDISDFDAAYKELRRSGHIANEDIFDALPRTTRAKLSIVDKTAQTAESMQSGWDRFNSNPESLEGREFKSEIDIENSPRSIRKYYSTYAPEDYAKAYKGAFRSSIPSNKKGGVIKAFGGLKLNGNYNPYPQAPKVIDFAADVEFAPFNAGAFTVSPTPAPETKSITFPTYQAYKGSTRPILLGESTTFKDFYHPGHEKIRLLEISSTDTDSNAAGQSPSNLKDQLKSFASRAFNYENLNNIGQVVGSLAFNHKANKVLKEGLNSPLTRDVFQYNAPAYYEDTRGFDVRKNAILNTELPQTSDAKLAANWKRAIMSDLDQLNREKYDYLSQNRNAYRGTLNKLENENRKLRVTEHNAFLDRMAGKKQAIAQYDATKVANDFKTFTEAMKKSLHAYKTDKAMFDQINKKLAWNSKEQQWNKDAEAWAKANPAQTEDDKRLTTLEYYLSKNPQEKAAYEIDVYNVLKSTYHPSSWFSPYFKKGGSLSANDRIRINKHKAQDQIAINRYKSIDKAVAQLNDAAIKIFLNVMMK